MKLCTTGGFWLLAGVLLLGGSFKLLFWFALACLVHEAGHCIAIRLLGGEIRSLRLSGLGVTILPYRQRLFSYREECFIALCGPLASLLLAVGAAEWKTPGTALLTGLSLALGLFNLFPAEPLDGGRMLRAVLGSAASPDVTDGVCRRLTRLFACLFFLTGLWTLVRGGSGTLLLCSLLLFLEKKK